MQVHVVHLVDPNRRIMSTTHVPCQRRDWWAHQIRRITSVLWRLPFEIFDQIIDVSSYPEICFSSLLADK